MKPTTYQQFISELNQACDAGDRNSKECTEQLAPHMAKVLKKAKEWDHPKLGLEQCVPPPHIITDEKDFTICRPPLSIYDDIISNTLGPTTAVDPNQTASPQEPDTTNACANLIMDTDVSLMDGDNTISQNKVTRFLKHLQPHREKPSKDRDKRFAAGELPNVSQLPHHDHDLIHFQFWAIHAANQNVRLAKCFLVGQVIYMTHLGKVCHSSMSKNPNTEVVLNVYEYDPEKQQYKHSDRSGLCKASKTLLAEIT